MSPTWSLLRWTSDVKEKLFPIVMDEHNALGGNLSYWYGWRLLLHKRSSHRWRMRLTARDIWINMRTTISHVVLLSRRYWFQSSIQMDSYSNIFIILHVWRRAFDSKVIQSLVVGLIGSLLQLILFKTMCKIFKKIINLYWELAIYFDSFLRTF